MGLPLVGQANGLVFFLGSLLCIGCLAGLLCNCARTEATHVGEGENEEDEYIGLLSFDWIEVIVIRYVFLQHSECRNSPASVSAGPSYR